MATLGGREDHAHLLADAHLRRIAVHQIGHHGHAFVERDIGQGVGRFVFAHGAERIHHASAGRVLPDGVGAQAKRADVTRVVVHLAAAVAFFDFLNKNKLANATINIIGIISVTLIISGPAAFLASSNPFSM